MTLALAVIGRETVWVVVDRRLSYQNGTYRDDAVKMMALEADDGVGLLIYAGLGATALGNEPSAWMSATLRGQGWLFENALARIAQAANDQLPSHLKDIRGGQHFILAPMFYKTGRSRLFAIKNVVDGSGRHEGTFDVITRTGEISAPTIAIAGVGTGARTLDRDQHFGGLRRSLHSLIKKNDDGRVSDQAVADRLAKVCFQVHQRTADKTVGPRSIVAWRRRPGSTLPGGGQAFYTDQVLEDNVHNSIPFIMAGLDVQAIGSAYMETAWDRIERGLEPWAADSIDPELDRRLSEISHDPDDRLR
ncbi:hypothetical protein [Microbacterium sp. Leaf151]|uniref:hypothetical protein n=1 Tax=Microbacterium sp. Leaf151 TaxID=1736276 RepID=UPI00070143ED|nr:hypothetical protein [Microbacterium sp. Leaf151]KQR26127.1 hypothetical protein ASF76_02380 [Microbacterium sp. Leaf151]